MGLPFGVGPATRHENWFWAKYRDETRLLFPSTKTDAFSSHQKPHPLHFSSMAALASSVSPNPLSLHLFTTKSTPRIPRLFSPSLASLTPPPPSSSNSSPPASQKSTSATKTENFTVLGKGPPPKSPELPYNYAYTDLNGDPVVRFVQSTESTIERVRDEILRLLLLFFCVLEEIFITSAMCVLLFVNREE